MIKLAREISCRFLEAGILIDEVVYRELEEPKVPKVEVKKVAVPSSLFDI